MFKDWGRKVWLGIATYTYIVTAVNASGEGIGNGVDVTAI